MSHSKLPIEYLLASSQAGLEGFELGRLDKISHLRKQLRSLVDQWVQAEIEAELARWLLECQRAQESATHARSPETPFPLPGAGIAAAFLPLAGTGLAAALPSRNSPASRKQLAAKSAGVGAPLAPRDARLRPRQQERARLQQHECGPQQSQPRDGAQQEQQHVGAGKRDESAHPEHQAAHAGAQQHLPAHSREQSRTLQRMRSPALEEAQGSLDFLEDHMRSETEALGPQPHAQHSWPDTRDAREPAQSATFPARNQRCLSLAVAPLRAPPPPLALHRSRRRLAS